MHRLVPELAGAVKFSGALLYLVSLTQSLLCGTSDELIADDAIISFISLQDNTTNLLLSMHFSLPKVRTLTFSGTPSSWIRTIAAS